MALGGDTGDTQVKPDGVSDQTGAMDAQKIARMGSGSISKLLAEFSAPAIVGLVITALYTFIDGIFIGIGVGDVGIAGTTVSYPMIIVTMAVALWFGAGGNALAALRLGEKNHRAAEEILGNTVSLSVMVSIALFLLCGPFIEPILWFSGGTEESIAMARPFILVLLAGSVSQCLSMGVSNFIRTAGAPVYAMVVMLVGTAVNIVLDYIFVLLLGWGMAGAGAATVIGQTVSAVMVLAFFCNPKATLRLRVRYLMPRWSLIKGILMLGLSSFIFEAATAAVNIIMNHLFVMYGGAEVIGSTGALAAMGAIERVAQLFFLPIIGITMGMQPLLGYNYGAGNWQRVRKTFWTAVLYGTVVLTALWAVVELFPGTFIGLFSLDDELVPFAIWGLRVYMIMCPILGFEVVGSNYYQATGQATKAALLTLLRQVFILIPLLCVCPLILPSLFPVTGTECIFIGYAACDAASTVVVAFFIAREMRRVNMRLRGGDVARS